MERIEVIETSLTVWKTVVLTIILHPHRKIFLHSNQRLTITPLSIPLLRPHKLYNYTIYYISNQYRSRPSSYIFLFVIAIKELIFPYYTIYFSALRIFIGVGERTRTSARAKPAQQISNLPSSPLEYPDKKKKQEKTNRPY